MPEKEKANRKRRGKKFVKAAVCDTAPKKKKSKASIGFSLDRLKQVAQLGQGIAVI